MDGFFTRSALNFTSRSQDPLLPLHNPGRIARIDSLATRPSPIFPEPLLLLAPRKAVFGNVDAGSIEWSAVIDRSRYSNRKVLSYSPKNIVVALLLCGNRSHSSSARDVNSYLAVGAVRIPYPVVFLRGDVAADLFYAGRTIFIPHWGQSWCGRRCIEGVSVVCVVVEEDAVCAWNVW